VKRALPTGTVTFLFTDIEGSTRLAAALGEQDWTDNLESHRRLIRAAVDRNSGCVVATEGDGFFVAFERVTDAVAAAVEAQLSLRRHRWPAEAEIHVRMGIHTGEARVVADNYVGVSVHEAARICAAAHGGQIVVSKVAHDLAGNALPPDTTVRSLGTFRLKDIAEPQQLFQLDHTQLTRDFAPLRTGPVVPNNLPPQLTAFIGRSREIQDVAEALRTSRLVTLLGPGGVGKTRLAIEVASLVRDDFADGVWMADLSTLHEPALVATTVADAIGFRRGTSEEGDAGRAPTTDVAGHLGDKTTLVVLDNCEHLMSACAELTALLLNDCRGVRILATSRERLAVAGETVHGVQPLLSDSSSSEAVELFLDRARMHESGFEADPEDTQAIEAICRSLDGLPLAIELAAAHVRVLSPVEIADRLGDRLGFLTPASRTTVERQRTLRSAIDWGYDLLSDPERSFLARLSVFSGGFALDAAEQICAGDGIESDEILALLGALVDKSFVMSSRRGKRTRYWLLETIRDYGSEKLREAAASAPAPALRLVREGEYWSVGPSTGGIRLRDSKGLRYLAILLNRPGRDVFVLDLVEASDPGASTVTRAAGDAGEVLDAQAVAAYRERLTSLDEEIAQAREWNDLERVAALEEEFEAVSRELGRGLGLGGRSRRAGSDVDRARMSVTKAIRSAITRIGKALPDVGRDLDAAVRTGTRCGYEPGPDAPAWEVRP
jgi:predicted ATPase/class 3 adenylate cyclase